MKITMDYSKIDQKTFVEIFEYTNSGIALVKYLPEQDNFSFLLANHAFYDNNVFVTEDVAGKLLTEVFVKARSLGMHASLKEVALTGKTQSHTLSYVNPVRGNVYQQFHIFRMEDGTVVCVFNDYTDVKNSEAAIDAERNQYLTTIQNIYDAIISTDSEGRIQILNNAACELSGWSIPACKDKPFNEVFALRPVDHTFAYPLTPNQNAMMLYRNDGTVRFVLKKESIIEHNSILTGKVIILQDITADVEHQKKEFYLLYHDPLTGLFNRSYMDYLGMRNAIPSPALIMNTDVNGLRNINNTFGFQHGDKLLKKIAEVMLAQFPDDAIFARTGEDDFTAVIPGKDNLYASELSEQIRLALAKHDVSISIGYCILGQEADTYIEAVKQAQEFLNCMKVLDTSSLRNSAIGTLVTTLQVKSHETEEHCQRLRDLSIRIGRMIGLTERDISLLEIFSILHDVGKITVPAHILDKPGKLTDEEWVIMKQHPSHGYEICRSTQELAGIAKLVLSHHERFDGKGYPNGLAGDDIPLLSRIIALADSYDAMTNDRVYRKALTQEEAMEELRRNRGTQFDPYLCDIFLQILSENNNL